MNWKSAMQVDAPSLEWPEPCSRAGGLATRVEGPTETLVGLGFETRDSGNGNGREAPAARAAGFRKMLVAIASDLRVVLNELADQLHKLRTLEPLPESRRQRMVREAFDVYAPLAERLGLADIEWQLEDEAFKYLMPHQYKAVSRLISRKRAERDVYTISCVVLLSQALKDAGVDCTVRGRTKNLYSTYQKLKRYQSQGRGFDEIYDLTALRVIVNSLADCYTALGIVHGMWRPLPGEFDDYIANPKENLYQSLHTSVIGPQRYPLEVQIRTKEMHRIAEDGVAAHFSYKRTELDRRDAIFEQRLI